MSETPGTGPSVRLDKWLWAARFYKTRSLAGTAVSGGKVQVNGDRPKRAKLLRVGDELHIRKGPYEFVVTVRALADRRGPASEAVNLYEESEDSAAARAAIAEQLRIERETALPPVKPPTGQRGRPTKKDRRELDRLKRRRRSD